MSTTCERLRPLLFRVAEGDAGPDDALATARHLTDCTACRIVLARERRLAAMLEEGLPDALPTGEDFVRTVMARLPEIRLPQRRSTRRALKLAGLAGLLLAATLATSRLEHILGPHGVWPGLPRWSGVPQDAGVPGALGNLGAAAGVAVQVLASAAGTSGPVLSVNLAGLAVLLFLALSVPALAATALGLASLAGPALSPTARASGPDRRG